MSLKSQSLKWLILSENGEARGPFSFEEMKGELQAGRLNLQSVVRPETSDEDSWDYLFSFVELKDLIAKPVHNKKSKVEKKEEKAQEVLELFRVDSQPLRAIVHDKVRIFEAKVKFVHHKSIVLCDLAKHSFQPEQNIFVHIFDPSNHRSVNIWGSIEKCDHRELYFSFGELPAEAQRKLEELFEPYTQKKAA